MVLCAHQCGQRLFSGCEVTEWAKEVTARPEPDFIQLVGIPAEIFNMSDRSRDQGIFQMSCFRSREDNILGVNNYQSIELFALQNMFPASEVILRSQKVPQPRKSFHFKGSDSDLWGFRGFRSGQASPLQYVNEMESYNKGRA